MKIGILALDGVFDTGLATLLDTFSTANELAMAGGAARGPLEIEVVGFTRQIRTAMGLRIAVAPVCAIGRPDWCSPHSSGAMSSRQRSV
jgi:hypothetical protein